MGYGEVCLFYHTYVIETKQVAGRCLLFTTPLHAPNEQERDWPGESTPGFSFFFSLSSIIVLWENSTDKSISLWVSELGDFWG
jgi:hypothetical protein